MAATKRNAGMASVVARGTVNDEELVREIRCAALPFRWGVVAD